MIVNANFNIKCTTWFPGLISIIFTMLILLPQITLAEEKAIEQDSSSHETRIYRNPAERREAGQLTEITDWLTFSGLIEIEKEKTRQHYRTNITVTEKEPTTTTLQLAFKSEFQEWLEAEIVFETEYSRHLHDNSTRYHFGTHSLVDEAEVSIDLDDVGLKFGRLNVPFGEYNSYFVTGPMLEFGETRRDSVMLDYSIDDTVEFTVFAFDSKVDKTNKQDDFDWGASFEYKSEDESIRIGASYISDLSESDEEFLHEFYDSYQQQVSAWSAYILFGFDSYELSLETVNALDEFIELDLVANKPSSINLELATFAIPEFLFACRIAHSDELEDAPEWEYGLTVTWLSKSRFIFSADYIYGDFEKNFVLDDDDVELGHHHQIAVRLAIEL